MSEILTQEEINELLVKIGSKPYIPPRFPHISNAWYWIRSRTQAHILCPIGIHSYDDIGDGFNFCWMCGLAKRPVHYKNGEVWDWDKNGKAYRIK